MIFTSLITLLFFVYIENEIIKGASALLESAEAANSGAFRLFGLAGGAKIVVALEGFLGVLVAKQHLVFFDVLDLGVFRDAFFVVHVILFDALDSEENTSGRNGLTNFLC